MGRARIGTSGFQYNHWRGVFYPEDLPKWHWLSFYSSHFDTVEINSTFYSLPNPRTFDRWRELAPADFLYVLKFSRYGTHLKRLQEAEQTITAFLERAARLGPHLGPILVQLPPHWPADPDRLASFLAAAPPEQRWAFEFRDPSWLNETVYSVLRQHRAALCLHDMIKDHPVVVTTEWTYWRFHGSDTWGSYSPQALSARARQIKRQLAEGLDVFAYFNNDAHGYAVQNARELRRLLGLAHAAADEVA